MTGRLGLYLPTFNHRNPSFMDHFRFSMSPPQPALSRRIAGALEFMDGLVGCEMVISPVLQSYLFSGAINRPLKKNLPKKNTLRRGGM